MAKGGHPDRPSAAARVDPNHHPSVGPTCSKVPLSYWVYSMGKTEALGESVRIVQNYQ